MNLEHYWFQVLFRMTIIYSKLIFMKTLIFIYKAKSDKISKIIDFAHKIVSPSTYSCDLCSLTYWDFSIKKEWREYVDNLNQRWIQTQFYYEESASNFGLWIDKLPAIIFEDDALRRPILLWKEFENIATLSDLESIITKQLW